MAETTRKEEKEIILNQQQEEAKKLIVDWYNSISATGKQTFVLSGYAGTGKTFLVNHIINDVLKLDQDNVVFLAPTGKASLVLIQRGAIGAMTVHRFIYNPIEEEIKTKIDGEEKISKRIHFMKKNENLKMRYKLVILDETSMVEKKVMEDLLSFGIPVLCCGDCGQLPPVGSNNNLLQKPDYNLTEIVRQSEDNQIVKVATLARKGIPLNYGKYGDDVIVIDKNFISDEEMKNLLLKADQVLCGRNSTRIEINQKIKSYLGYDSNKMNEGEKIMCCVNNWTRYLDEYKEYNLVNGVMGTVYSTEVVNSEEHIGKFSFQPDFLEDITDDFLFDTGGFSSEENFHYDMHQKAFEMPDGTYKINNFVARRQKNESKNDYKNRVIKNVMMRRNAVEEEMVHRIVPAYCISVHKSQGSEWNKVVIFSEEKYFAEKEKWLYTAITRAKQKLVIIK